MSTTKDSETRIALVTGASRGIGAAIAHKLAADGCYVIGTATSDAGAQTISDALGDAGTGTVLNVTDSDACEAVMKTITAEHGAPTVLINNAGITRDNLLLRLKDEDIEAVIAANLTGSIRMSKLVLRGMMKARWGRIVNIGSVVGSIGNAGQVNYAATKAGLLGVTKSLAREVGSRGITVNLVAPGFIDTDMTAELDAATQQAMLDSITLGRLGQPADIAAAVSFLCSDAAAYITGETLHVNGGLHMA